MAVHFEFDRERATQTVLWFLHKHGSLDSRKLLKLVFLVDCAHLAAYGRPIIGGRYVAMKQGPVQSELYDLIKEAAHSNTGAFRVERKYFLCANAPVDEEFLSQSDMEILEQINDSYGHHDGYSLSVMTHQRESWKKNAPVTGGPQSVPIPYEDILAECCDARMRTLITDDQEARSSLE